MKLLLDTHVFLWVIAEVSRLPPRVRDAVASGENEVALSVASIWECVIKYRLGKLDLPEEPALYLPRQRSRHGFESLPVAEGDVLRLAHLPSIHKDPFDRILVAQAQERGMVLVTADPVISRYPVTTLDRV